MSQRNALIQVLKSRIQQKGYTYAKLATELGMSESGIKRMFSEKSFGLERLEQLCGVLGVSFQDLFSRTEDIEKARVLNKEQELALASDEKLFVVFNHIIKGYSAQDLLDTFTFSQREIFKMLRELDELGLIELHANNRIRMKVDRHVAWEGALEEKYRDKLLSQFIDSDFEKTREFLDFLWLRLSDASQKVIEAKMKKLVRDIRELAEIDTSPKTGNQLKDGTWIMIAMRGAGFALYQKYRRAPRRCVR